MEDYILQQELESLARNAPNPDTQDSQTTEPVSQTVARWQKLFDVSEDEAIERIMNHRNNLTRSRVSEDHWESVCSEKEDQGYDKEAYEYELDLQKNQALLPNLAPVAEGKEGSAVSYLIELCGLLHTPEKVKAAAALESTPPVVTGRSVEEGRAVRLCCIDGEAKTAILRWVSSRGSGFEPTILVDPRSFR